MVDCFNKLMQLEEQAEQKLVLLNQWCNWTRTLWRPNL